MSSVRTVWATSRKGSSGGICRLSMPRWARFPARRLLRSRGRAKAQEKQGRGTARLCAGAFCVDVHAWLVAPRPYCPPAPLSAFAAPAFHDTRPHLASTCPTPLYYTHSISLRRYVVKRVPPMTAAPTPVLRGHFGMLRELPYSPSRTRTWLP